MWHSGGLPRDIRCDPRFVQELATLIPEVGAADDFQRGAEWVLARNPEAGTQVSEFVWFLPAARYWKEGDEASWSTLVIYYGFDERRVYLFSIQGSKVDTN